MNPWYGLAKEHGRYYLVGLVREMHDQAARLWAQRTEQEVETQMPAKDE